MAGVKLIITVILALVGLYYLVAPHDLHVKSGFGFGLDHTYHMLLGVVLLVVAAVVHMKMKK